MYCNTPYEPMMQFHPSHQDSLSAVKSAALGAFLNSFPA